MALFQPIIGNQTVDNCPIILAEYSNFTSEMFDSKLTIFQKMSEYVNDRLVKTNVEKAYLMFWASCAVFKESETTKDEIAGEFLNNKMCQKNMSHSELSCAFKQIPTSWLENKKVVDIYIVKTSIFNYSDNLSHVVKEFLSNAEKNLKTEIRLKIIDVYSNKYNGYNQVFRHNTSKENIHNILQKHKLTHFISEYISHCSDKLSPTNECSNLKFMKPNLSDGMIPFGDKCFNAKNTNLFVEYVSEQVKKFENETYSKYEARLLIYDVSISVHHLVKNVQKLVINDILCMFRNCLGSLDTKNELRYLVESHMNNRSIFRDEFKLKTLEQNKEYNIVNDGMLSIETDCQKVFYSFPICTKNGKIIVYECHGGLHPIQLGSTEYNNMGFRCGNYVIPVIQRNLARNTILNNSFHESTEKNLREWINVVYGNMHNLPYGCDTILCLFLTDVMRIVSMSSLSTDIKNTYKNLAFIMLRTKMHTSIHSLLRNVLDGKKPVVKNGIENELQKCIEIKKLGKISPLTLWYHIVRALGNETLIKNQEIHFKDDVFHDCSNNFTICKKYSNFVTETIVNEKNVFHCCFTMKDTTETGGYELPVHKIGNIMCNPKYVISEESFDNMKNNVPCPICCTTLNVEDFKKISPKSEVLECSKEKEYELDEIFDTSSHKVIDVTACYDEQDIDTINETTTIDSFWTKETQKYPQILSNALLICQNSVEKSMHVTNSHDFKNELYSKLPFLKNIDLKKYGMCIMGGLCKSILLDQKINDIDLFFVTDLGENNKTRLENVVDNLICELKNAYPKEKLTFLSMYKKTNNVYELLCLKKVKILRKIVDNDNCKLLDNLISECTILHKIQIVARIHTSYQNLVNATDLYSSNVVFDGENVLMSKGSYYSFKYMINVMNHSKYSNAYESRLVKYFDHGFRIVLTHFDKNKLSNLKDKSQIKCGQCILLVKNVDIKKSTIIVDEITIDGSKGEIDHSNVLYNSLHGYEKDGLKAIYNYLFSEREKKNYPEIKYSDRDKNMNFDVEFLNMPFEHTVSTTWRDSFSL
jgi:hypothetical protein